MTWEWVVIPFLLAFMCGCFGMAILNVRLARRAKRENLRRESDPRPPL